MNVNEMRARWAALPLVSDSTKDDYSEMAALAYDAIEKLAALSAPPAASAIDDFMQGVQRTSNEIKAQQRKLAREFQKLLERQS